MVVCYIVNCKMVMLLFSVLLLLIECVKKLCDCVVKVGCIYEERGYCGIFDVLFVFGILFWCFLWFG